MGRAPCCDKANVKKGPWSPEEDVKLKEYIEKYGTGGNWIALPQKAGLKRCGKSCRLRWLNYLRPNIKHGEFTEEEDRVICTLFTSIGSRWSIIAAQLPGRTDNDIKNYWNTKLKKKLMGSMANPHHEKKQTHQASSTAYHHHHLPAVFQSSSSSPLLSPVPSSSSPYPQCSPTTYYNSPSTLTFTAMDHQSFTNPYTTATTTTLLGNSSNILTSSCSIFTQEGYLSSPMQNYLMLGGTEASCSSSDGSCSNQIFQGREMEYEYGSAPNFGDTEKQGIIMQKQGFFYNGLEENQKFMGPNDGGGNRLLEKPQNDDGFFGDAGLEDYYYSDLEEIKKLISSSSSNNNNASGNFFFDENKTAEERVTYYGC
ncbi:hypothetical protein Ancab_014549 [Ancistrocladus abbreviatus]